jgi:general secretion pathway protein E
VVVLARVLYGFGVTCVGAAFATVALATEGQGMSTAYAAFRTVVVRLLQGPEGWVWAFGVALVSGASASCLWTAERLLSRVQRVRRSEFAGYGDANVAEMIAEVRRRVTACLERAEPNVVTAFDEIVRGAISAGASDIHLSPTPDVYRVTYRIVGTLYEAAKLDPRWAQPFATRIKVLAGLETHVRKKSQDGRLVLRLDGTSIEARVSTLPTEVGERIVLRIVRGSRGVPDLVSLDFSEQTLKGLTEILARPQGMLFVTGPVGSGKTTTLYSALKYVVDSRGKMTSVVTLEDPIELELPFATQTQMHSRAGRNFANTLRSVLRQDPNVLMIGEIRDHETADIASQAGLTGHLILTTLHADSAAGPFTRLIDMDIEPFVVASATIGCLSQRLVRTLCKACRREEAPDAPIVQRFAALGAALPDGSYYVPTGCRYCEGEGFTGRAPVSELLVMTPEVRDAVIQCKATSEIFEIAKQRGLTPLLEDGLARAARGDTSLAEVLRVTG